MKTKRTSWYFIVLMVLSFAALARTNYFGRAGGDVTPPLRPASSFDPLLVDNRPLNYALLSTTSRGLLTVIPETATHEKGPRIPFRVYIKRNGELVANNARHEDQSVTEIELKEVLTVAQPGDWLVIEPVQTNGRAARHTLLLKSPLYSWLLLASRDGC
jgi:hypothetical protein